MHDYNNVKKNLEMRVLANLMLNSFLGKFGQRQNQNQVTFVEDLVDYFGEFGRNEIVV